MLLLFILQEALKHRGAHHLYITHVFKDFECDVHFPDFDKNVFKEIRSGDYHLHVRQIIFAQCLDSIASSKKNRSVLHQIN